MKTRSLRWVACIGLLAAVISCNKNNQNTAVLVPHLPTTPYEYITIVPPNPGNPYGGGDNFLFDNTPQNNITTNAGAALGRVLFYDKILSVDNQVACGSCHKQAYAFTDQGKNFSHGYEGGNTARNAIGIWNERFNANFFFDGRATTLEQQTLMPVENHIEMGMEKINVLPQKLGSRSYYAPLFSSAFGDPNITAERIADALAQFMRSIVSMGSKSDMGANNNFANFSPLEQKGMQLFSTFRCNTCHQGVNMNNGGNDFANIGLDMVSSDPGLMDVTGQPGDQGRFRIPSLRNIALTAPYMHDGRYKTLDDVLNHYSTGIANTPNLDFRLTNAGWGISDSLTAVRMNMTPDQKQALIAFLNTLTDYNYINDPRFSDPFK